jgi:hypothetical protein
MDAGGPKVEDQIRGRPDNSLNLLTGNRWDLVGYHSVEQIGTKGTKKSSKFQAPSSREVPSSNIQHKSAIL